MSVSPNQPYANVTNPVVFRMTGTALNGTVQAGPTYAITGNQVFDVFQQQHTVPPQAGPSFSNVLTLIQHPFMVYKLMQQANQEPDTLWKAASVLQKLSWEGQAHFASLLKQGVLAENKAEDGKTTLHHLYAMASTPRAEGFNAGTLLNETVRILNKPYTINQRFAPLSENIARQILQERNRPYQLNRAGALPIIKPMTWEDIDVQNSATCVSASVMYYMADKNPSELTRHLSELTSPLRGFFEQAKLSEISPDNPAQAIDRLKANNIQYVVNGPDEVTVLVKVPYTGYLRAINDSLKKTSNSRGGVESAYQSALTFLATNTYDPATDYRQDTPGTDSFSKGLTEDEKTLMETIIKDNGGVKSVTYQVVGGKQNPGPGEESLPFLYGYTRNFDQTINDLVNALKMGEFVIVGITDTDGSGAVVGGHEITVTSVFQDPKDKEIKFIVVDSDDNLAKPRIYPARELVPRIHHAGMPLALAKEIRGEIGQMGGYFLPDAQDAQRFDLMPQLTDTMPADAFYSLFPDAVRPKTTPVNPEQTTGNAGMNFPSNVDIRPETVPLNPFASGSPNPPAAPAY